MKLSARGQSSKQSIKHKTVMCKIESQNSPYLWEWNMPIEKTIR